MGRVPEAEGEKSMLPVREKDFFMSSDLIGMQRQSEGVRPGSKVARASVPTAVLGGSLLCLLFAASCAPASGAAPSNRSEDAAALSTPAAARPTHFDEEGGSGARELSYGGAGAGGASQPLPTRSASHPPLSAEWKKGVNAITLNEIAVLPLVSSGRAEQLGPTDLSAFTQMLIRSLQNNTSLSVLNVAHPDKVQAAFDKNDRSMPPRTRAFGIGKALGVQAVLHGAITRFDLPEQSGPQGSESAAFTLWLVDSERGQTVWTATFQESSEAITDNLLDLRSKLKRGIGFKSSEQLLSRGFDDAARSIEKSRSEAREAAVR